MKNFSILCFFVLIISSCGLTEHARESLLGEAKDPTSQKTVSKEQYDELARKYEKLAQETNQGQDNIKNINNEADETQRIPIDENPGAGQLVETVDVFADANEQPQGVKEKIQISDSVPMIKGAYPSDQVSNDIILFRRGLNLIEDKDYDNAMRIFKTLQQSPIPQVRVRAKYQSGEILLQQGEYDLALQVFEDIIHNYAFSGVVIPSLRKLIFCTDKLNIEDKKEKYTSVLVDIFEQT